MEIIEERKVPYGIWANMAQEEYYRRHRINQPAKQTSKEILVKLKKRYKSRKIGGNG